MSHKLETALILIGIVAVFAAAWLLYLFQDQSLVRLQRTGTIRIGYAVEAPYAFPASGGEVSGAFPELAQRIAADLNIQQIEWVQADFDSLIPDLEAGRFDVIAAGLYITHERAGRVAFSEPALRVQQALLVRQGNPRRLHSYQQALAQPDVKIAVIAGAAEEPLLRRIGLPGHQILLVPDARTGRTAVESGLADGLALTSPTLRWLIFHEQAGQTELAQPFEQPDPGHTQELGYTAFAFRKTDRQLLAAWNTAMRSFMSGQDYLSLLEQFHFSSVELPGAVTTEEVLSK